MWLDCIKHKLEVCALVWLSTISYSVAPRIVGAADTISSMMAWWTLTMVAYPDAQSRAHAELVSVVGCDRLPAFADYPHLPYLRVVLWSKEVLRWKPAAPLSTPHRSTESD